MDMAQILSLVLIVCVSLVAISTCIVLMVDTYYTIKERQHRLKGRYRDDRWSEMIEQSLDYLKGDDFAEKERKS